MASLPLRCVFALAVVSSSGVFELKVHSFNTAQRICRRHRDCHIFFRICLKHSEDIIHAEPPCTFGTGHTNVIRADQTSISSSAPIRIPFHFKWPGTFSLIIEAWNAETPTEYTDNQNNLVSRLATRRRLAIGEDWSQDVHFGEQSELRYSYHVFCDEYYFGDSCAEYCRPRDDTLGHYTCDVEGNKQCLEGWKGNYCSDRKFNLLGTCMEMLTGGYTCRCPPSYTGSNCEKKLDHCSNSPCLNGESDCSLGEQCTCRVAYVFWALCKQCDIPCTTSCATSECGRLQCTKWRRVIFCLLGGECLDLGQSVLCRCHSGFTGANCQVNIDDCASAPCQNAGTCQDGMDDYTCSCTLGYAGKNCSLRSDACGRGASAQPCQNGGTCFTHFTGPVCQCPPGFMGPSCEFTLQPSFHPAPQLTNKPSSTALTASCVLALLALGLATGIVVLRRRRLSGRKQLNDTAVFNDLKTGINRFPNDRTGRGLGGERHSFSPGQDYLWRGDSGTGLR
uniref:Delta-like protein n=1 Tax=Hucho hucho TaxID=62062 RepID=A0A4W5RMI9_9TELE